MTQPYSIYALAEVLTPERLRRELAAGLRAVKRPLVIDLFPGSLNSAAQEVCEELGVEALHSEELITNEGVQQLTEEGAEIANLTCERLIGKMTLRGVPFERLIWHNLFWYRLRPALLAATIVEKALATLDYFEVIQLGANDLTAGLLEQLCHRRGCGFRAVGIQKVPHKRLRRRIRSHSRRLPLVMNERLARYLRLLPFLRKSRSRRQPGEAIDLLLLSTLSGEIKNWQPVAKSLGKELHWGVASDKPGILNAYPAVPQWYLPKLLNLRRLRPWLRAYEETIGKLLSDDELPRLIPATPWRGTELRPFLLGSLVPILQQLIWTLLPQAAMLEELLELARPKLLVGMTERLHIASLGYLLARRQGIPTLALESHDIVYDSPVFSRLDADKLAVSSDYTAAIYHKHGIEKSRLVVTGEPTYDHLAELRLNAVPKSPGEERTLAVFTQPLDLAINATMRRELLSGAAQAIREMSNLRLVIKPHPRDDRATLLQELERLELPEETLLPKSHDLYALLANADVVLTFFSTVGVEALLVGKPVVLYKPDPRPSPATYVNSAAVLRVADHRELASTIGSVLSDENLRQRLKQERESYLRHHEAAHDANAARRVAELIEEML
ncbi:CDP-glycerol glycerophosphotransferase family protein [bacterium]|nr:CDP-glycerol glycerophosphotransferase family protein [bacterium]